MRRDLAACILVIALLTLYIGLRTGDLSPPAPDPADQGPNPLGPEEEWLDALLYMRNNTEENAIVFTWWDYGRWVKDVAGRDVVTRDGLSVAPVNVDMGRFLMSTGADELFSLRKCDRGTPPQCEGEVFIDHHTEGRSRPAYIIVDKGLMVKFYWVSRVGEDCIPQECAVAHFNRTGPECVRPSCGTRFTYLYKLDTGEDQGGQTGIFMNYVPFRQPDGTVTEPMARIDLMVDMSFRFIPVVRLGNLTDDGEFHTDVEGILGNYIFAGNPKVMDVPNRQNATIVPGMVVITKDILLYMEDKARDMLFTRLFFLDGKESDEVELVHTSPGGNVKVFRLVYPEDRTTVADPAQEM